LRIINPSCKTKWLEAGVTVFQKISELIMIHSLNYRPIGSIYHQPWATQMIAYNPIGDTLLDD